MKVVTSLEARAFAEIMVPVLCLLGCLYRALGYLSGIRYGRVKLLINFDGDPCYLKRGNKLLSGAYPKKTGDYFAHDRKFALFQRYGEKEIYRIFLLFDKQLSI